MKNTITVLTKDNFDAFVESEQVVAVYFSADWCEPCHAFAPIFKKVAEQYADLKFGSIDVEKQKELADDFNIRSVPTLIIFREHVALCMESGTLSESTLTDLIKQAQALDMKEVRKTIAEQWVKDQN
ncbi:MAG: thioredoxin family protein [Gammaproteobacteria bacterium]|nr:thioredoxin family protein [Gammaproteobacteria bacterium]